MYNVYVSIYIHIRIYEDADTTNDDTGRWLQIIYNFEYCSTNGMNASRAFTYVQGLARSTSSDL